MRLMPRNWPLSETEALQEAYTIDNQITANALLSTEIAAWQQSLDEPNASKIHIEAEINRLERMREPVAIFIDRYNIEEPIDLKLVLDIGDYWDAAEAELDRSGEWPGLEFEALAATEILEDLKRRNDIHLPQAA